MSVTQVVILVFFTVNLVLTSGSSNTITEDPQLEEGTFNNTEWFDELWLNQWFNKPLILTDLIESGNISEAQELSKVSGDPFPETIPSYSGYFTVNKEYNSNLFFWFFPAELDYENAPVLLWLQGGPGSSSLFGLFTEVGPFSVDKDNTSLVENQYSWHKNHSIIFIDNPVGTGFSFTDNELGYATNQTQVGAELYVAMIQFFTMFPDLQKNDFFITGESYAGKFIPALGYNIHKENPSAEIKINLQGIAIGNGFTDPITSFKHSEYLFQFGLVDTNTRNRMRDLEEEGRQAILSEDYIAAYKFWGEILVIGLTAAGYKSAFNILRDKFYLPGELSNFLNKPKIRRSLHVGDDKFEVVEKEIYDKMIPEFMVSVKPWLEVLLDNYRVMFYSGQLDIIVAYPLSVNMYQTLNYSATDEYLQAERKVWRVDGELAGYMKSGGNFTEVLVRNAGHLVASDQPAWALDLITRFTFNDMLRDGIYDMLSDG